MASNPVGWLKSTCKTESRQSFYQSVFQTQLQKLEPGRRDGAFSMQRTPKVRRALWFGWKASVGRP